MPYVVGVSLALAVAVVMRYVGFDRDRSFYPTVLMVVALYYVLFAVMGGSMRALLIESLVMMSFAIAAVVAFKRSAWIAVAGLAAHGVMDAFHGLLVSNPGVPEWWPAFCLSYDLAAAAGLAWILRREGSKWAR